MAQVSARSWSNHIRSKGSKQKQDKFLREFNDYRKDYELRKTALTRKFKGDFDNPSYVKARAAIQEELEQRMTEFGFYEYVDVENLSVVDTFDRLSFDVTRCSFDYPVRGLDLALIALNVYRKSVGKRALIVDDLINIG